MTQSTCSQHMPSAFMPSRSKLSMSANALAALILSFSIASYEA